MTSDDRSIPVAELDGEYVRQFEARLPALSLDMPEGYVRGTHMNLEVEVRVRTVNFPETKDGDLIRQHMLVLEEVRLKEAFDPADRPDPLAGTLSGSSEPWEEHLLDFLHGDVDELNFDGEEIPERLREMAKAYFDLFGGVSTPVGTPSDPADDPEGVGF